MNTILSYIELAPMTFAQSLLFSLVALAIAIPFRFLGFSDLSSEASFPLGGALCGTLLLAGVPPILATVLAFTAGCLVGVFTGAIHLKFRIHSLLCGILAVTMFYSVSLRIMGRPNLSVLESPSLFSQLGLSDQNLFPKTAFLILLLLALHGLLLVLFNSQFGLRLRVIGANPKLAETQGANLLTHTLFGLALANGLSALSGSLVIQSQGYADIGMGFGVLINGLAAMMLGEFLLKPSTTARQLLAPVLGTVIFYQITSFVLCLGLEPSDLKLMTGLFVLLILALPSLTSKASQSWPVGQN